jgi:sirohydrochlorin ferrochelatase
VLAAHGSRRAASNREVEVLAERLRARASPQYRTVELGFLELAEPTLGQALDRAVAGGVTEVVVVPYFLAAGRHVTEDVPNAVREGEDRHPSVRFVITPHLGETAGLAEVLLGLADAERGPPPDEGL